MRVAPASEFKHAERLPRQFRRQIPNSVMDDRRLGLAELARLCLDAAQKDGFAPSAKFVRDRISMGAYLYKSVNAELKQLGYLARQQTRPCEFASHRLNLSAPQVKGMTRKGFTIPLGAAGLPYKHYAVAEWMHSHAPGFIFYPSIIRDRFGISAVTVKRLMAAMQASGFVTKHQFRDSKSGQFDGFGYSLNADSVIAHGLQFDQGIKNRPRKNRPRKIAPHNITYPSITAAPPNQPSMTPSANEGITSRKNCERPSPSQEDGCQSEHARRKAVRAERKELKQVFRLFDDAAAEPMRDTGLYTGINESDRMLEAYFADAAGYADLSAFSDSWLGAALRKATDDRIGRQGIKSVGLPCYGAGVTPNSPARNGPGTVGLPVVAGGVAVNAGDIVLGDEDGVVIVPAAMIVKTIERLPVVRAAEADLDAKVKAGLEVPPFIQNLIDAGRFTEVS